RVDAAHPVPAAARAAHPDLARVLAVAVTGTVDAVLTLTQRGDRTLFLGVRGLGELLLLGGRVGEQQRALARSTAVAELVHPLWHRGALVLQWDRVAVFVDRSERLVQFDVRPLRQPLDDAGLDAVLEHRTVAALQADCPPVRDEVDDRRQHHHADAADPGG